MVFRKNAKIWMVGIKGAGMAGLAQILKGLGYRVQGSDTKEKFYTDAILKRLGISVLERFSPKNVRGADFVVASNAYMQGPRTRDKGSGYGEVREAKRRSIPVLSYPEAVGELFNNSFGIAVAGTHGKSTTAAMIGVMLEKLGADPTALIGAEVLNWESNARVTKHSTLSTKPYFVLEADEYKNAFLHYQPNMIVLTNVEWDHPDVFPSFAKYAWAFKKFIGRLKTRGIIIVPRDNRVAWRVAQQQQHKVFSFGKHPRSVVRVANITVGPRGTLFSVFFNKKRLGAVTLQLFGEHHAYNAVAAIACGLALGYPFLHIKKALKTFQGTRRRFEILSPHRFVPHTLSPVVIDDYAHHPTEIAVTIRAARQAFPRRPVHILFQPHTFSRTQALFRDFVKALHLADRVYILTTYGSARERKGKIGSRELAKTLRAPHFATHQEAAQVLRNILPQNAILLAVGAGDQWRVAQKLLNMMQGTRRKR